MSILSKFREFISDSRILDYSARGNHDWMTTATERDAYDLVEQYDRRLMYGPFQKPDGRWESAVR